MKVNALTMQEFMVFLVEAATSAEEMKMSCEVHHKLRALKIRNMSRTHAMSMMKRKRAPKIGSNEEWLNLVN